jgi:ABC-type multidrug transport system ATPase subunit
MHVISETLDSHSRLQVLGLAKRYRALAALRDATFDVRRGEVLGLLGPNGSGKTTLMQCLAGLVLPDAGEVRQGAQRLSDSARQQLVFYLPDGITPWADQPAHWLLEFFAETCGVTAEGADDIARVLRVDELGAQRIGTLSKGQRKRLLLAAALRMPQPVILLDEPFDGLDLRLTREVIALFHQLVMHGRTLVVSLHAMHDAARVCDRLVLLNDGVTVAVGTLAELRARASLPDAELDEVFLAFV